MAHYGKQEYWHERYKRDKMQFEWYQDYFGVRDTITQYIKPSYNILILGCGNSKLGEELFEDGFKNIISVDYCEEVID